MKAQITFRRRGAVGEALEIARAMLKLLEAEAAFAAVIADLARTRPKLLTIDAIQRSESVARQPLLDAMRRLAKAIDDHELFDVTGPYRFDHRLFDDRAAAKHVHGLIFERLRLAYQAPSTRHYVR